MSDEVILFRMATRLTLADGLGFLAALLELHATPPGQVAVGEHDNMPGNDSANAYRTMVYTLRRGIGLFVCQRPELFLKVSRAISKISKVSSKTFKKYPKNCPKPFKDTSKKYTQLLPN